MRLSIDISKCIGCGLCEETLPGLVVNGTMTATVVNPEIPDYLVETARVLVSYCPEEALHVAEDAT